MGMVKHPPKISETTGRMTMKRFTDVKYHGEARKQNSKSQIACFLEMQPLGMVTLQNLA